jgi:hypothetical protein
MKNSNKRYESTEIRGANNREKSVQTGNDGYEYQEITGSNSIALEATIK